MLIELLIVIIEDIGGVMSLNGEQDQIYII